MNKKKGKNKREENKRDFPNKTGLQLFDWDS